MMRWSLSKLFTKVSYDEFADAVRTVGQNLEKQCGQDFVLSISFYNALKHSCTMMLDDYIMDSIDRDNESKIFERISTLEDMTYTTWNSARYVEADIRPSIPERAPDYTFAQIEAKGLLPKQLCFYAQGGDLGTGVMQATTQNFPFWRKGDGYNSNHSVSLR